MNSKRLNSSFFFFTVRNHFQIDLVNQIQLELIEIFNELKSKNLEQKDFAENAKGYEHPSILFSMLNGKDVSPFIWKLIKPEYSKPFWQKVIES
jgi:hypothetical protein